MAGGLGVNAIRNLAAGFLAAYGWLSVIAGMLLQYRWVHAAPHEPNPARGLLYEHNEHGGLTYLSQFQTTSFALMLVGGVLMFALAFAIGPKKNVETRVRWYGVAARWDPDDPQKMGRWGAVAGVVAILAMILVAGAPLVRALNGAGFFLNLG